MKMKIAATLIISISAILLGWFQMDKRTSKLEIAASNYWGRLEPAFQSTSAGDTLLGNVFEPLVDLSITGGIAPGLAERWESNDESTLFRFHFRKNIRYSDGTPFAPSDFISSWTNAVQKTSLDSEKPNTLDVLYKLKGFSEEALKQGRIPGLRVVDGEVLELEFEHPFRTALFELTGTRYATWKEDASGRVIGTGPYQIVEHIPGKIVRYQPNPFSRTSPRYQEVVVHGFEDARNEVLKGKFPILIGEVIPDGSDDRFDYIGKGIAAHKVMDINGGESSLFKDPDLRRALLYAIHFPLKNQLSKKFPKLLFDPQIYAPFWEGRLPEEEALSIIEEGKKHLEKLVEASKNKPLRFVYSAGIGSDIENHLKEMGIHFQNIGSPVDKKTLIETVYAKSDFDLTYGGASVVGNDPDGIYHLLGKNGAITSKAIFREKTTQLLEEGRKLKRSDGLNRHYQKVSRAVLEEVPIIHIRFVPPFGFINKIIAQYDNPKVNSDRFNFDSVQLIK